jgi:hypothetical protein
MKTKKQTVYQTKLQDPRWQKNRLLVLERDDWSCTKCQDNSTTLHVHHIKYEPGKEPWDYPLSNFVTLCADCHREVELLKHENGIDQILLHKEGWTDGTVTMLVYAESLKKILYKIYLKDQKEPIVFEHSIESFFEITEFYQKAARLDDKDEREYIQKLYFNNPDTE